MSIPTLDGITAKTITSSRLSTRVLFSGADDGIPVLFIHGNASSATFWEETMLALPAGYRGIAPDQRGYGEADSSKKIDATRGLKDLSDDAAALLDTLNIPFAHVIGHSMGGSVLWQMMMDYAPRIYSVTVVDPGSPFGFGGTKGNEGEKCFPDAAGSGGGIVNVEFAKAIADNDRGTNSQVSPRNVMNAFYWKPPFIPARIEDLLSSVLSTHIGEQDYPGDFVPSENYPFVAPGKWGVGNALSPKYADDVSRLYAIENKPNVLWIRGSDDQIVGDNSLFDMGTLGAMGAIPNYPGVDVFPSQPMVGQTRFVLQQYAANGGSFNEVVIADTGHSPYIEKPAEFNTAFHDFIKVR